MVFVFCIVLPVLTPKDKSFLGFPTPNKNDKSDALPSLSMVEVEARDEGTSLFDWLCKPHIFGGIASTILMRICSRPSFYLTEGFLEKVLVFQLVVSAIWLQKTELPSDGFFSCFFVASHTFLMI